MEFWFNPSVSTAAGDRTSIELETAQRFRNDPRNDTWFVRGWIKRDDARGNSWGVGIEQRWNGPDQREVRLLQQVGYELGPIDLRTRVEQRFVSTDPQTGWRVRQRIGASIPLGESDNSWSLTADAELFVTLRSSDRDGQTGVTGLRTFVGFEREFGRYEVSLGYLRQQDVRDTAPDRIGNAPFIGVAVNF
ncbi:DUF2490 domain-containing protein [Brevundimonas sp.]|uniref:DUF2490 domain-containing protein n=1 Tax=Brevundimonas sp. TaxID=1871086 RepID=UPI00286C9E6A|nr:DUF2490 domain-containing protein [Brevundimonas sp.]